MKKLIAVFALIGLIALAPAQSQDVQIPLQEFTLEVPTVNKLVVRPLGAPLLHSFTEDTTQKVLAQYVYYELKRADGRTVESGNKYIPDDMFMLIRKYILGTIDASDIEVINDFFLAADWPLTAILPNEEE